MPVSPPCLGSIPAEFGQLSKLEHLYLNNNQLAGLEIGDTRAAPSLISNFPPPFQDQFQRNLASFRTCPHRHSL
jgi:hypothetical protein